MTLAAFGPWYLEFSLEVCGALRTRRYPLLSLYLAVAAIADIATFSILQAYGWSAYAVADWIQLAIKYLILIFLACQVCGKMLAEKKMHRAALIFSTIAAGIISAVYQSGETITDRLLDAEIAACMFLGILILVAWFGRIRPLDRPWAMIAGGIVTLLALNGAAAYAWKFWEPAKHVITGAEIASLVLFNLAPGMKLSELRQGIGVEVRD